MSWSWMPSARRSRTFLNYCGRKFSLKIILFIADQAISRIEYIYSRAFSTATSSRTTCRVALADARDLLWGSHPHLPAAAPDLLIFLKAQASKVIEFRSSRLSPTQLPDGDRQEWPKELQGGQAGLRGVIPKLR
jgi:hypothetical protein